MVTAAYALAEALRAVHLDVAALGEVRSASGFAAAMVAAKDSQSVGASGEALRRTDVQTRVATTAGLGEQLLGLTTDIARSAGAPATVPFADGTGVLRGG